jgi:hypothetical protein
MKATAEILKSDPVVIDGRAGYLSGIAGPIPLLRALALATFDDEETRVRVMFTRDVDHHLSGWLKNPDYERCLHLSLSPAGVLEQPRIIAPAGLVGLDLQPLVGKPVQQPTIDRDLERAWIEAFYGDDARYVWAESPKSEQGRLKGTWHYRVFCDAQWVPLVPRGEVYSTRFTELGWKSFSELGAQVVSTVDPS